MRRFLYSFVLVLTALHVKAANNVLSYIYDLGSKTAEVTFDKDSKGDRIYYSGHIVIPDVVMFSDEEYMVTGIQPKAFMDNVGVTSVIIGNNVRFIGGDAFNGCTGITSISIPASVDSIGEWAFSNTGLTEVRFEDCDNPVRLWDWGGFCVFSSSPLETVYLGRNYISGARPFKGIQTLKTVCLGGFVDSLPGSDFEDCSNLEQIYSYLEIPPVCGPKVFNGVVKQTCRLYVPDSGIELYKVAYAWNEFFNIESGIDTILTDRESGIANGIRFNIDGRRLDTIGHGMNIISTEDGKAVKVFER
ncbi:MAG: leucine-rich repeat domain-containing protein [Bacteroidaceae bacterium]|nr:leucine-rich repeat domain-containing protein [Bacteroidaceae bacterium]